MMFLKFCPTCKKELPEEKFYYSPSRANRKGGPYSSECKKCSRAGARSRSKERYKPKKHDPIKCKYCGAKFVPNHGNNIFCGPRCSRLSLNAKKVEQRPRFAAVLKFRNSVHRARRLKRTPPWSETKKIERVYMLADWASRFTDEPLEVDHIIPLQGEMISGLHVFDNLQILKRSENRSKWNKFEENE